MFDWNVHIWNITFNIWLRTSVVSHDRIEITPPWKGTFIMHCRKSEMNLIVSASLYVHEIKKHVYKKVKVNHIFISILGM